MIELLLKDILEPNKSTKVNFLLTSAQEVITSKLTDAFLKSDWEILARSTEQIKPFFEILAKCAQGFVSDLVINKAPSEEESKEITQRDVFQKMMDLISVMGFSFTNMQQLFIKNYCHLAQHIIGIFFYYRKT